MPRGDRTGPRAMGPMSGRAAGFCSGRGVPPGYATAPGGYSGGFGRGRRFSGGGRGRQHRFWASVMPGWMGFGGYNRALQKPDPETEKQALSYQAKALQSELEMIKKRLEELETRNVKE